MMPIPALLIEAGAVADFRFCPLCARELEPASGGADAGRLACPEGHFVHYDNPAVTVMGFIRQERAYLVLRRAIDPHRGRWDMPGGFVESGEHPAEALRREVHEETGLDIAVERLLGVYASEYGDTGRHTVDVAYTAHWAAGDVRLSPESSDARWVQIDEFPDLAFASERRALEDLRALDASR
jgi:ADP-ribose pyrophosphatase YjhB (NUDIX family)